MKNRGIIVISSLVVIGGGIAYLLWKRNKNKEEQKTKEEADGLTPKADTPKADTPKADTPKADTSKADTPKADKPKDTNQPKPKYPIFNKGNVITPKIPYRVMNVVNRNNQNIGETKKAVVVKQIEASPEWLLVTATIPQGDYGFPVQKSGYILTKTAQLTK
jgi:hypothetical protein